MRPSSLVTPSEMRRHEPSLPYSSSDTVTPAAGRPRVVSRMCVLIPMAFKAPLRVQEPLLQPQPRDLRLLGGCVFDLHLLRVLHPLLQRLEHVLGRLAAGEDDEDEAVLLEVVVVQCGQPLLEGGAGRV